MTSLEYDYSSDNKYTKKKDMKSGYQ